jgi:hypothetical protein
MLLLLLIRQLHKLEKISGLAKALFLDWHHYNHHNG